MPEERIPQPPGPNPPIVRPAFTLRCEHCREPSKGPGQRHKRISADPSNRVTYYNCWHCYHPRTRKPSVFKVIRQEEQDAFRTRTEEL